MWQCQTSAYPLLGALSGLGDVAQPKDPAWWWMVFATNTSISKSLKEFRRAGKEISVVKRLSSSVLLGEIHRLLLLPVHQLTEDCHFLSCVIHPSGRGSFFPSGEGSPAHRYALVVYQLVYPGLPLPCFESLLLLASYCSSFCLEMVMSGWDPSCVTLS